MASRRRLGYHNFDFWSIPYLLAKGLQIPLITRFHELGRDLMKLNDIAVWDAPAQATTDAIDRAMTELFAGVTMAPAKYTRSGPAVAQT